jgi:Phage integrase family
MAEYIDQQPWRHNTITNARYALDHVRRHFGEHAIGRVHTSDLQAFVTALQLEPRTVQSIWQYLRSTLRAAHLDGVIGRVLEALAEHVRQHGTGEHGELVHAAGRPLNANRTDWRWDLTTRAADVDTRLHDLRHHYASSLISAGCSIVAVQRALGHARPSVTLDLYGHLMPADEDRIRGAIDVAWIAEDGLRTPDTSEAL